MIRFRFGIREHSSSTSQSRNRLPHRQRRHRRLYAVMDGIFGSIHSIFFSFFFYFSFCFYDYYYFPYASTRAPGLLHMNYISCTILLPNFGLAVVEMVYLCPASNRKFVYCVCVRWSVPSRGNNTTIQCILYTPSCRDQPMSKIK